MVCWAISRRSVPSNRIILEVQNPRKSWTSSGLPFVSSNSSQTLRIMVPAKYGFDIDVSGWIPMIYFVCSFTTYRFLREAGSIWSSRIVRRQKLCIGAQYCFIIYSLNCVFENSVYDRFQSPTSSCVWTSLPVSYPWYSRIKMNFYNPKKAVTSKWSWRGFYSIPQHDYHTSHAYGCVGNLGLGI